MQQIHNFLRTSPAYHNTQDDCLSQVTINACSTVYTQVLLFSEDCLAGIHLSHVFIGGRRLLIIVKKITIFLPIAHGE